MSDGIEKEVLFGQYCQKCKNRRVAETEDPCNECLTQGFNYNSNKPINFEKGAANGRARKKGTA